MKIGWVIPGASAGSGGIRTVIQNINGLDAQGYDCGLHIVSGIADDTMAETEKARLGTLFDLENVPVSIGPIATGHYDLLIATAWSTVHCVILSNATHRGYFIQDFEPFFYPMGSEHIEASNTYGCDLEAIALGRWLPNKLFYEYGLNVRHFDFCADLDTYHDLKLPREHAICAIYQPEKPRRCTRLLLSALRIVSEIDPEMRIYLYGSKPQGNDLLDFHVNQLGIISTKECNELYNKCLLGVCCSSSNPSRIPFEMMSTGLPVVDLYAENNLYDFPDNAISLAESTPEALATAIMGIADSPETFNSMHSAGIEFMTNRPLENETRNAIEAIERIVCDKPSSTNLPGKIFLKGPVHAGTAALEASTRIAHRQVITCIESKTFEVRIHDRFGFQGLSTLKVPIWCAPDQSDIVWYDSEKLDDCTYSVKVSLKDHSYLPGEYQIHVYGVQDDETMQLLYTSKCYVKPSKTRFIGNARKNTSAKKQPHTKNSNQNDRLMSIDILPA